MECYYKSFVTLITLFAAASINCYAHRSPFHQQLSKDQLQRYFEVDKHDDVPEYSIVNIRLKKGNTRIDHQQSKRAGDSTSQPQEIFISTESMFGHAVQMVLTQNEQLVAPSFRALKIDDVDGSDKEIPVQSYRLCHYVGSNGSMAAAISNCERKGLGGLSGILLLPDGGIQVQPVDEDLAEILGLNDFPDKRSRHTDEVSIPHLVFKPRAKKLSVTDEAWEDEHYIPSSPREEYEIDDNDIMKFLDFDDLNSIDDTKENKEKLKRAPSKDLYMELALFFDQKGYELFMPHVGSESQLVDLLLGYVNQMQALYQQPSLGKKIQISLVRLEMMKRQPRDLPHADGERDKLLDAFCSYQEKKNPDSDSDPNHWDIALYVSGLNFYSMEGGKMNGVTMGLAPVGGVCMKQHSCVIAEFGTVSEDGRPYPSAGLLSTYIAVHEIGHNLGMYHDGPPSNKCPANGHVMSPSRGTKGETTWSSCSSEMLQNFNKACLYDSPQMPQSRERDHSKHGGKPGQVWDAHDQCKIFLRDEDSTLLNDTVISMVCEQTLCKTPQRIGYYAAGPALEGTYCGAKKWCQHGDCVSWGSEKLKVVKGGWSDWKKGDCKAGCVSKSKGVITDKRYCDNPKPKNTEKLCDGDNIRIHFCDDSKLCKSRSSPVEFAKQRCEFFSQYLPDVTPVGVQVKYNENREWQSCAVYCKMKSGMWYTPRQELNDRGIDTFFPEGTWCHNNGMTDFYCQNRLCLPPAPKGRSLGPSYPPRGRGPEVNVPVLNNANPKGDHRSPPKLREFFQYKEGRRPPPPPGPDDLRRPKEDDYAIIDYVSPYGF